MADHSVNAGKPLAKLILILIATVMIISLFFAAKLATPYLGAITSFRGIWVAAQLIILAVWKINNIRVEDSQPEDDVPIDPNVMQTPYTDDLFPEPQNVVNAEKPITPVVVNESIKRLSSIEENDSIDATWKAIMDGGASPVRPPLQKSDTWEGATTVDALARQMPVAGHPELRKSATVRERGTTMMEKSPKMEMNVKQMETIEKPGMRKSATFREKGKEVGRGGRGREVLVMGNDELFGRVEAFIKMHHDHLRMQRQESVEQRLFTGIASRAY